jgi:hypothetical protein
VSLEMGMPKPAAKVVGRSRAKRPVERRKEVTL